MVEETVPLRSPGFTDPGWEHGVAQDEKRKKVKCNYCGKIVSGGIYRLKQHLARISGEVTFCRQAPEEVYIKMKQNLAGSKAARKRQLKDEEQSLCLHSSFAHDEDKEYVDCQRKKRRVKNNERLVTSVTPLQSIGYVDPGWEHGVAQDETKKKVKCNYCKKIISGGINRFKQHLARIPGEVAHCNMVPEEVYLQMKENMKWHRTGRRGRTESKELPAFYMHSDDDKGGQGNDSNMAYRLIRDLDVSSSKSRKKLCKRSSGNSNAMELQLKQINLDSMLSKSRKNCIQPSYNQLKQKAASEKRCKEVISAICKFFYYAAIPSSVADSPYFHKMLDLVSQYGHGLNSPGSRLIAGRPLQDEVESAKVYMTEIKASWPATGCSIMVDSWKDVQDRTIINFLVSCLRGTYFLSSIDASDVADDVTGLFELLDKVVEEVGEANVVQVITENTTCFKAAGKLLEEKRRSLFWTPCAAYCLNQILEDFSKLKLVRQCIEQGQKVTRFIYNSVWLLNFMKKEFIAGKELLKPAVTKSVASFLTLQCLLDHQLALKRMFLSSHWISSRLAKTSEGKEVEKIVLNSIFWKRIQYVKKSVDPVVQILQKLESNKALAMPSMYNDVYRAKLAIKANHADDQKKYGPFWSVIDSYWNTVFHHSLFVAAYFLNPSYRYRPDFMALPEVIRGLNECITRLEQDNGRRVSAAAQISDFVYAKADFGTDLALSTRMDLDPAAWWQQHGINCLELQGIAIRVLSQPCTLFDWEHNWSAFDQIHCKRRNSLAQKRLNDFAYVHYNLRLREKELKKTSNYSFTLDSVLLESLLDSWIVDTGKQALQDDEEIFFTDMELAEYYINEVDVNENLDEGSKKSHTYITGFPETVESLEVVPAVRGSATGVDNVDVDCTDDDSCE